MMVDSYMQKISVVMSLYNGEEYLVKQLESIKSQTLLPDEIVFVDDASSTNPSHLIESVLDGSGINYSILINDKNQGSNYCFRKGVKNAVGDVIFFSDQDDIWLETKIQTVINFFNENTNASVVINDCYFLMGKQILSYPTKAEVILSYSGTIDHFVAGCCTSFNKVIINAVNNGLYDNLNYDDQVHEIGKLLKQRYFLNKPVQLYRRHLNNQSVIPQNNGIINTNILRKNFNRIIYEFGEFIHINLLKMNKSELEDHKKKIQVLSKSKTNEYHNQLLVVELINLLREESFYKFLTKVFTKGVSIVTSSGVFLGVYYLKFRGIYR
jgi:glycosyltransferase involved in cell wall biosynthesis